MDMSNVQWWAKPAPTMTAPANQQLSNNGFTIPGLGNVSNAADVPFDGSRPRAIPLPKRPVAAGQSTTRKKRPHTPSGVASNSRDKIMAPSAASGGVPDPTPEYLHRASLPSTLLPTPRPILVVMDLNGTLLHRPNRRQATSFVERPHARRFLQYCLDTFHVVVWSSARPGNVQSMCDQLLLGPPGGGAGGGGHADRGSYRRRVLAVWGRDRFGLTEADYQLRVQVYKRLELVWREKNVQAAHPDAAYGGRWDQTNTVLVDDSSEKARSEPYNLLRVPEFFGNANEPGYIVPQIHDYLNALCHQSDVSAYMRENPFEVRKDYKLAPIEQ
ncbi:phosphoprotein phosphatase [Colletotrichum higginsianum IMI 349063]|uniref:Mitochondrial import inner membrane translocase subunit TIM50 n=3 Tax=Colletotrichum destructivum species complex TaxID=2707350 RepID=A0A1B7YJF0_COLHI|nr:phosphoprotein phosphatase [Colletotrichum higginsianum IMI 349063]OBR12125.1 phosphoprotein phosphatase [Colletotrichum higginsianum IMI 349063]TIC98761.1 phosphoprotein phosphatase [Colletotrichum higginsianum]GJC93801.1 phosphoprotein phosphatase [Colletotrichum higginsianum]